MKNLNTIGFLIAFFFLASCSKEKETVQPDPELNNFNLLEVSDQEKDVFVTPMLTWEEAGSTEDGVTYDIYLDENSSPSTKVASNTTDNEFKITGKLKEKTTYYWKVKAKNKYGKEKESKTFSFTTGVDLDRILVSGPWNWTEINNKNLLDDCVKKSSHEFKEDGTVIVVEYLPGQGGKCPAKPIEKTYDYTIIDSNRIIIKYDKGESKEFEVNSFTISGRGRIITMAHFEDPDRAIGMGPKRGME